MRKLFIVGLALGMIFPVAGLGAAGAVAQTAGTADRAVDRELVSIRMNADGVITRTSLLDSLTVHGNGRIRITDSNASTGVRNLIGFQGAAAVSGTNHTWDLDVQGTKELLTVASSIKGAQLPVSVVPSYFIGDRKVKAADIRGHSGEVAIEYRLANITAKTENVQITDQFGKKTTAPIQTYVPFVAQASFELPADVWQRIDAPGASIVTDEDKLNHVTFTSILAPVVGRTEQTIRLAGRVKDFEMSEVRIAFQPLLPPSIDQQAATSAAAATKLYDGVGQIDGNLIKLQQGTLELVNGLSQLYDGILQARSGLGDVGTSDTIVDGLSQVLDGLKDLGDTKAGVPAIKAGVDSLIDGVEQVLAGLGSTTQSGTILGGLSGIDSGLGQLAGAAGLGAIKAGIDQANAGVALLAGTLGTAPGAPAPPTATTTLSNDLQFLQSIAGSAASLCDTYAGLLGQPSCTAAGIGAGTMGAVGGAAQQKVDAVRTCMTTGGVPGACAGGEPNGLSEGLSALSAGTQQAIGSIGTPATDPLTTLRGGMAAVIAGLQQLKAGLASGDPDDPGILEGLEAVADGLTQVIAGIGTVGTADTLTDGVDQLFGGAGDLADGIDQIAGGTFDARSGAQQIEQGQYSLSEFGTKALQAGVGDNVQRASAAVATLEAMKRRAANESFLYGPPTGAEGSMTYVFQVGEINDRNVSTAVKFGIGAVLLVMLLGAGTIAVRRPG